MTTLSKLERNMKVAAFDIAVRHLIRSHKTPEKAAARILRLCSDFNHSALSEKESEILSEGLLPLLRTEDENTVCIWLKDQVLSSK